MNDEALELLHKVFVECEEDKAENMPNTDSMHMYLACTQMRSLVNETIPGKDKNHKMPVAVKNNGMYIAVAHNKATGHPVNKKDTTKFYDIVDDIKSGDHGTMLTDAIYASSVGFKGDALVELETLSKSRKMMLKTIKFQNSKL